MFQSISQRLLVSRSHNISTALVGGTRRRPDLRRLLVGLGVSRGDDSTRSAVALVVEPTTRYQRSGTARVLSTLSTPSDDVPPPDDDDFTVTVDANGSSVRITTKRRFPAASATPTTYPVTLPAWWLWTQDPQGIHSSSGQRQYSLGYTETKSYVVREAQMVTAGTVRIRSKLHPPPPKGSYHSRGNIYSNTKETEDPHRILLQINWENDSVSYYDWDWLCQFSNRGDDDYSSTTTRVTSDLAIGAIDNPDAIPIPTLDYHSILNTPEGQLAALDAIIEHGALLVPNAPILWTNPDHDDTVKQKAVPSDAVVAGLGKRLSGGRLSHGSLYGDTFRVVNQPNAQNIAYTSHALAPHQDLAYYESKPFLQLLQCISHTGQGGASVLVDALAAAEYLRTVAPDLFNVLCQVEATFVKQRPGADIVSFKPHIRISSHTGEVIEVNWSPPFEGPPPLGGGSTTMTVLHHQYLQAYHAMECLLDHHATHAGKDLLEPGLRNNLEAYSRRFTWEQVLEPGDILVFNNQRMCHGRRRFWSSMDKGTNNERHLVGCYTDAMETINTYRVLRREQKTGGGRVRSVGNGTRGSSI